MVKYTQTYSKKASKKQVERSYSETYNETTTNLQFIILRHTNIPCHAVFHLVELRSTHRLSYV